VRAEAEFGSRTTLDVLNAEQELLDAQSNRIFASASVQLASYALLESMGQLTVASLNLGIPTYDVEAYSSGFSAPRRVGTPSEQGQRLDRILGRHTRPCNTGPCNTGPCNTGPCNTGPCNTGPCNTGPYRAPASDCCPFANRLARSRRLS